MSILRALLNKLTKIKPFEDNYSEVKESLKHAINVCERWIECCHYLTGRMWKVSQTHKWENEIFSPVPIVEYNKRLKEVSTKKLFILMIKKIIKKFPILKGFSHSIWPRAVFDLIENDQRRARR